jgi:GxxExxY protein
MHENEISEAIIGAGLRVHKELGPGLPESAYEECLAYDLVKSGLYVERQKDLPLVYHEVRLDLGYRVDILVEGKVVMEVESVDALNNVHLAQVLTYPKALILQAGIADQLQCGAT